MTKYKVSFSVDSLNDHSVVLERDWRLSDFKKDKNRDALIQEAVEKCNLSDDRIKTFKIEIVE